jgi:Cu-Zn family superoxide dismutase
MSTLKLIAALLAVAALAGGCFVARQEARAEREARFRASAVLEARSGSQVSGTVVLREDRAGRLWGTLDIGGLAPGSVHGFHVHEKPDCSAPDAMSAGGHFNPAGSTHGNRDAPAHHAGDLPNLVADASGRVHLTLEFTGLTLGAGPLSIVGHSLVVHRDPDDYATQPSGNSGPRLACGVIVPG